MKVVHFEVITWNDSINSGLVVPTTFIEAVQNLILNCMIAYFKDDKHQKSSKTQ